MPLRDRIAAAWRAFTSESPGLKQYAETTVRTYEHRNDQRRYQQQVAWQLVQRFSKFVAVAASRQATGVASANLRVYRTSVAGRSRKTWWDTRDVKSWQVDRIRKRAGYAVRKAMDSADDLVEITDPLHPLVKLLTTANPLMNTFVLLEQTQYGLCLTGNAYWHVVAGDDGMPVELWPLPPQYVHPVPSREVVTSEYVYGRGMENEQKIPASHIIPFIQTNPLGDPYTGFGDLAKCIDAADLSVSFDQFRLAMIDNGAQPGLIVVDKKGGPEQRAQLEQQLNRKFSGPRNAGRTVVLTGEVEAKPNGLTEREVAFLSSDEHVREIIANCFDIPVALLTLDSAALATAKAATPQFQEFCLLPRCRRIEDVIQQRLVPSFGDPGLIVCFDDVVTKDYEAAAVRVVSMYSAGLVTQNEARAEMGYDSVDGGDDFIGPVPPRNVYGQPVQTESEFPSQQTPTGDTVAADKDAAGVDQTKEEDTTKSLPGLVVYSQRDILMGGACPCGCSARPRSIRKALPSDVLTYTEAQLKAILQNWFSGSAVQIVTSAVTANGITDVTASVAESFAQTIDGPINEVFSRGWNYGSAELVTKGVNGTMLMPFSEKPAQYLREYKGQLSKSVSETVNERIKTELADGVLAGETVQQLTDRVRGTMTEMSGVSAERIARTETSRAFGAAREASWKESGEVWGKRWLLAPDACAWCREMAKKVNAVPLGTPFAAKGSTISDGLGNKMTVDFDDVQGPPLHPNDRCDMVMVMEKPT